MGQRIPSIRVEIDPQTDVDIDRWAKEEGRSKRRHLSILTRKLAMLRKTAPGELARLGLLDRPAAVAH